MKKKNRISILLIMLCLAVLFGYRTLDLARTDRTAPVITMEEGHPEFSVQDTRETLLRGITAMDNRDGDVTDSLVVESIRLIKADGTAYVSCAAFDKSGNVARSTREIRFTDYESPRFRLNRPLIFSQSRSNEILGAISASDMLDGNISHRIRATVLEETESQIGGSSDILFTVSNSLGDTVELVLPVELYTPGMFEGTLELNSYLVYLEKGSRFDANSYLKLLKMRQEEYVLRNGIPEGMELSVEDSVNTNVPGVYEVDYLITCNAGDELVPQIYTARSKLIVVVEG